MTRKSLAIGLTAALVVVGAALLHTATAPNNTSAPTSISFSADERQVSITDAGKSWNFYRPDVVQPPWMLTPMNPFGGQIYYVANSGNDTNPGSLAAPFLTIEKGIAVAQPGDILYVQPGTYNEHVVLNKSGTPGQPIVLSAAPGSFSKVIVTIDDTLLKTLLSSGGNLPAIIQTDPAQDIHDVWVNGLVVQGYRGSSSAPAHDTYSASGIQLFQANTDTADNSIHITNNVIYNNLHCGIKGGVGTVIEGNVVFDNGTQNTDHGIYAGGTDDQIIGNIVFNNTGAGLHIFQSMYAGDVNGSNLKVTNNLSFGNQWGIVVSVQNSLIQNNVAAFNAYGLMYYSTLPTGSDTGDTVTNNIFAFNSQANGFVDGSDGQASAARQNTNDVNDVYASGDYPANTYNYSPQFTNGPHTVFVDPLFTNAQGGDYRLQADSPLSGSGIGPMFPPPVPTTTPTSTPIPSPTSSPTFTSPPAFDDEFDAPMLDNTKWSVCYPWDCHNAGNGELTVYSPNNLIFGNGVLDIQAVKQQTCDRLYCANYGSSLIQTGIPKGGALPAKFTFQYGYVETRLQVPMGIGYFPAFWLLGQNTEIDLMEQFGSIPTFSCGVHLAKYTAKWGCAPYGNNLPDSWHTFGVDWQSDHLAFYYDGQVVGGTTDPAQIPNEPMYIIADFAVGANFIAPPDLSSVFPADFRIDYVRVWTSNPTPTPTPTQTATSTPSSTVTITNTATPSETLTSTPTASETATDTPTVMQAIPDCTTSCTFGITLNGTPYSVIISQSH